MVFRMAKIVKVDVVVVGAGPSGSSAAEHAALNGASVIMLEKRPEVGRPVRCGEFMPSVEEMKSIFPKATELESIFDIPNHLHSLPTDVIRIFSPRLRHWDVPFTGYTTDRDLFDQYLASKAVKAGAELRTGLACNSVKGRVVSTPEMDIEAKVVIGADGPLSLVGKNLGYERSTDLCPAVTVQVKGDFEPIPEMYFGTIAPGGYAWVLPKKGYANVGLGVAPRFSKMPVGEYFDQFLKTKGIETKEPPMGKFVPMSGPIKRTVIGDSLLVGDAAGQVMAVNGGGIPIAMMCGRMAGQAAAGTALKGLPLTAYEERWRREVYKPLRTAVHTKWLANTCFGSQWRLEMAMRFLGQRRINKLIRCKPVLP
jgi:digeranylgeranylglycerophospholipid reductase